MNVRIDLLKCKKCNQCLKAFESQVTCLLDCSFWMFIAFVFVVVSLSLCFCWLGLVPGTLSPHLSDQLSQRSQVSGVASVSTLELLMSF